MLTRIALTLALAIPLFSFDENAGTAQHGPVLVDQKAKNSYAVGVQVGNGLKKQAMELDAELVSRGVQDALAGAPLLSEAELTAALEAFRGDFKNKQVEAAKEFAEKQRKEGEAFLAQNKAKEGVVSLESGLQYKVLKAGDGKKPATDDTVVCHYRGTLIDGTEFDSSIARNRPATLPLKQLIKGWTEALQLMPAGSKWQLFIPPDLAYGVTGPQGARPSKIGPNATLIFEVELLSVQERVAHGGRAKADEGVTGLQVSFKLDPRITKGQYMGERWVSPPTYTTTLDTVDARVAGTDSTGGSRNISAKWVPSDPEMVTVTPGEGREVKIAVKRTGETALHVTSDGISKQLSVKAAYKNDVMLVEIAQK
jgi:FKBP-type peptidyl-prolyl cis-trans isomerase